MSPMFQGMHTQKDRDLLEDCHVASLGGFSGEVEGQPITAQRPLGQPLHCSVPVFHSDNWYHLGSSENNTSSSLRVKAQYNKEITGRFILSKERTGKKSIREEGEMQTSNHRQRGEPTMYTTLSCLEERWNNKVIDK